MLVLKKTGKLKGPINEGIETNLLALFIEKKRDVGSTV
jgi:hypothetical protein